MTRYRRHEGRLSRGRHRDVEGDFLTGSRRRHLAAAVDAGDPFAGDQPNRPIFDYFGINQIQLSRIDSVEERKK